MQIIGIDPGKTGGIAIICARSAAIIDMIVMPEDPTELAEIFVERAGQYFVFVEKAQAMPKNGAVSMFNYGQGFGTILGILIAVKARFNLVPPKTWTKVLHVGATGKDAKAKSLQIARRLYPEQDFRDPESKTAKKPHEGLIDAVLIAEWGRRIYGLYETSED